MEKYLATLKDKIRMMINEILSQTQVKQMNIRSSKNFPTKIKLLPF